MRVERSIVWREQSAHQSMSHAPTRSSENSQAGEPSRIKQEVSSAPARTTLSVQTVQAEGLLPLTVVVMEAPMPKKKMPPMFKKYDKSTDLDEHLRSFVNTMAFYSSSDLVLCRAFSLSLKGEALAWFNTLPPNTVDCFTTIRTLFNR